MNLRLSPGVDIDSGKRQIENLHGVERVRQVFPDEEDQELSRMFVLEISSDLGETTLATLRRASFVEEVEPVPKRRARG